MSASHIDVSRAGGICHITLNRPERRNALTHAMYTDLTAALKAAEQDAGVRVICLQGAGGNFSSGNDLQDFREAPPATLDAPVFHFLEALRTASKPVVAEVRGVAIGVGTTLLLHCDLVYCDDTACFQLPFVNLGLCPEAGSSLLLPLMAGHQRASALLMLGDMFDARQAQEIGMISGMAPAAELTALVSASLARLAAQPAASLRLTKALLKQHIRPRLAAHMREEAEHFMKRLQSPEAAEAMAAFSEKRRPDFLQFG